MLNRIKGFLYDVILFAATITKRSSQSKKALIVKTDEIGDYILWRKFIPEIIAAKLLNGYQVHLCANQSWQALYNALDGAYFENVIWVDKALFKKNAGYRFKLLRYIYKNNYSIVINPIFSRDKRNDDSIVRAANAALTLGMSRNNENYLPYEQSWDKNLYTKLFTIKQVPLFDFYRNKQFTEFITGVESEIEDVRIENSIASFNLNLPEKYFVVFPGSRSAKRIWHTSNFIKCAEYLYKKKGLTAVVCGSKNDKPYCDLFVEGYQKPVIDLTQKTTLEQMLFILKNAFCLLSVDTGSIHLAASVGCTVFGIFNGSQYGRFSPYPLDVAENIYSIYPDLIDDSVKDINIVNSKYQYTVDIPYDTVTADKVIKRIKTYLNSR